MSTASTISQRGTDIILRMEIEGLVIAAMIITQTQAGIIHDIIYMLIMILSKKSTLN